MKKIILLGIIIILLIPVTGSTGEKYSEEDLLMGMLNDLNGDFLEGDIDVGGAILDEFIGESEVEKISEEVKDFMGILGTEVELNRDITELKGKYYSREVISHEGFNQVSIYGYDKNENPITVITTSYLDNESNNGETSLYINLIKVEKNLSINGIMENINSIYKKYGKVVDNTICIIGEASGKLKTDELNKDVDKIIEKYRGKIVEEYSDENLLSYTIYTPFINKEIFSGKKRINLNLAIRYNEFEDKTYFWIGTPIITTGY